MLCRIIEIAMATTVAETATPTLPSIIFWEITSIVPSLNVVSIVEVSVSIDTHAAAKLIALEAENTGLLYFLYFITFTIAAVKAVKVYAAIAIAVIM